MTDLTKPGKHHSKSVNAIRRLLKAFKDYVSFRSNGFSLQMKVRAVLLYMAGLSCGDVACFEVYSRSHEAARLWVKRMEQVAVKAEVKRRRIMAVDETRIKADGEWCYVWAAVNVDAREPLAVWVSWRRSILHT